MANQRKVEHTKEQLLTGSKYLKYHIKMYVETFRWLHDQPPSLSWNTQYNSILESHLIHVRILINFLSKSTTYETDVLAIDYFHDDQDLFHLLNDDFLRHQADNIGSDLVHITTKPMPNLKSEQKWPIAEIESRLVPALRTFFVIVSETKLVDGAKIECLNYLALLSHQKTIVSLNAST